MGWGLRSQTRDESPGLFLPRNPARRLRFGLARVLWPDKIGIMRLLRLCAAAGVMVSALFGAGAALADPKGLWLAQDGARVKVGPCGAFMRNHRYAKIRVRSGDRAALDGQEQSGPGAAWPSACRRAGSLWLDPGRTGTVVGSTVQRRQWQQLCRTSPRAWPHHHPRRRLCDRHLRRPEYDADQVKRLRFRRRALLLVIAGWTRQSICAGRRVALPRDSLLRHVRM